MKIDQRDYRNTIGLFATGVTVVTVQVGDELHGMTANAITSLSLDPLLLLVCIERRTRMAAMIGEAGRFGVNILRDDQEEISRHYGGKPRTDLSPAFGDLAGAPILADSLAALVCSIERVLDGGDHIIVIGRVEALQCSDKIDRPLLFFGGQYRQIAA